MSIDLERGPLAAVMRQELRHELLPVALIRKLFRP
jgi:hypothetical protein